MKIKTIKLILVTLMGSFLSISCLVDDEVDSSILGETSFVVGFERATDSYVFTPANTAPQTSGDIHVVLVGGGQGTHANSNIVFRYEVDSATTMPDSAYNITSSSDTFTIPANGEVANETFSYEIIPTNIILGTEVQLVINLVYVSGPSSVAGLPFGKLIITANRCDPFLIGTYTAANTVNGSSNGDGETVVVTALGCNTYQASNLPNFNSVQFFDFILNEDNSTITLTGTLSNFSNLVTGSGVLLSDGTIQIDDFDIEDNTQDMSFDLVPN
jgi:hypothetical protein